MKKLFILLLICGVVASSVYAMNETGDRRAVPVSAYGKTSGGVVTALQVDNDGRLVVEGGGGGSAEGWNAEGDGIVFDSATYTDGLTISDVNVTLDNTSISILNTDGVLNLDGSIAISQSLSANDFWVTSDNATISSTGAQQTLQFNLDGNVAMDLTIDGTSAKLSTAPLRIGTDLTTDGTDLFWKGEQLNS